jgi:dolichyl-phosphate beta-glucosyltransferase
VCLAPLAPRPYAVTPASTIPPFFNASTRWRPAGRTVVVLPYPTATQTQPLAWQAAADMAFQMPGGYFIGPAPGGQAFMGGPGPVPTASTFLQIEQGSPAPPVTPALRARFRQDMAYWRASAIVAGPGASPALVRFVQQLTGRVPVRAGGVLFWRQP